MLLYVLGFCMCLPLSVIGWVVGAFLLLTGSINYYRVNDNLVYVWWVYIDSWFAKLMRRGNWAGFSIGNNAFVVSDLDEAREKRSILHEETHCLQQYKFGLIFPLLYIVESVYLFFFQNTKHSYFDNRFEIAARKAAGQKVHIPRNQWPDPTDRWIWW